MGDGKAFMSSWAPSASALIGLQFVVITLIADFGIGRGDEQAGDAFATPSVVHFGVVLVLSAMLSAPWNGISTVALLWGLIGVCGLAYVFILIRHMRMQRTYRPVFEDWQDFVAAWNKVVKQ